MSRPEIIDLKRSTAIAVTDRLRVELLDGTIAAGSRIMPADLARRFAVSIVPIREALRSLEAEGLIVTSPQRATFATDVGLEDLRGVYGLRQIVEPELARRAAGVATDEQIAACVAVLERLKKAAPYSPEFFQMHRELHWSLLAPASANIVHRFLDRLWQSVDRYVALAAKRSPRLTSAKTLKDFYTEHAALVAAMKRRDADKIGALLETHISETEKSLRKHLKIV